MWQSSSMPYSLELSLILSLPMCLINLICLMLIDWAFFRCFINLVNHLWSIQVHFLSFDPFMRSKGIHITNSLLASNSEVSSLNSFGCLTQMVALLSSCSFITHWMKNALSFEFVWTTLIFLIVINWMWSCSNCCGVVDFFLVVTHHPFHPFWNNFWSNGQYQFYSIQLQVCHKLLTL